MGRRFQAFRRSVKRKKMEINEVDVPYCHSEPMQPIYRYMENGVTYREWQCNFCHAITTLVV
jgi:hypothetical protein